MYTLAISKFSIPGEAGFPLNAVYPKPATAQDAGTYRINLGMFDFDSFCVFLKIL